MIVFYHHTLAAQGYLSIISLSYKAIMSTNSNRFIVRGLLMRGVQLMRFVVDWRNTEMRKRIEKIA